MDFKTLKYTTRIKYVRTHNYPLQNLKISKSKITLTVQEKSKIIFHDFFFFVYSHTKFSYIKCIIEINDLYYYFRI